MRCEESPVGDTGYRLWRAEEEIPCGMTFLRCTYCFGAYIGGIGVGVVLKMKLAELV